GPAVRSDRPGAADRARRRYSSCFSALNWARLTSSSLSTKSLENRCCCVRQHAGSNGETHMAATIDRLRTGDSADLPEHLRVVAEALDRLRYGVIQLTVHDGKLMQVDVTERRRFS